MNSMIQMELIYNRYMLKQNEIEKIVKIIEWFLTRLKTLDCCNLSQCEKIAYLGIIAESYPLIQPQKEFLEICHILLKNLNEEIAIGQFKRLSMVNGLCNLALFVEQLSINSGYYKNFSSSLNMLIFRKTQSHIENILKNEKDIIFYDYDVINGVSGIANFILDHQDVEAQKALRMIAKYLVRLTCNIKRKEKLYPGWYEKGLDPQTYPEGYFDYSISHGIAGPLYILIRLSKKHIIVQGQIEAISKIINNYASVSIKNENVICSGKISFSNWNNNFIQEPYKREGWCYGSVAVAKVLLEGTDFVNNIYIKNLAQQRILEVSSYEIEQLGLDIPILCHGYAGTAAIFRCLYDVYKNSKYLKQAQQLLLKVLSCFNSKSFFGFPCVEQTFFGGNIRQQNGDRLDVLEGSAGVIMEMLSWISKNTSFEKMLLLK